MSYHNKEIETFSKSSSSSKQQQQRGHRGPSFRQNIPYTPLEVYSNTDTTNHQSSSSSSLLRISHAKARRILYLSYTIAQLADVTWEFSITIFMSAYTNFTSLFLVSSYGITSGIFVLICNSSILGNFIDSVYHSRSTIMIRLFLGQIICALVTTCMCYSLFVRLSYYVSISKENYPNTQLSPSSVEHKMNMNVDEYYNTNSNKTSTQYTQEVQDLHENPWMIWFDTYSCIMMICLHIFGGLGKAIDKTVTIALEKDWVVVISKAMDSTFIVHEDDEIHSAYGTTNKIDRGMAWKELDTEEDEEEEQHQQQEQDKHTIVLNSISSADDERHKESYKQHSTQHTTSHYHHHQQQQNSSLSLTQLNVTMKQIDLTCKFIGPAVSGFIFNILGNDMNSMSYAALLVGMLEVSSIVLEYFCTRQIYSLIPTLGDKKLRPSRNPDNSSEEEDECLARESHSTCYKRFYWNGRIYWAQRIHMGGLSLAFLYSNVLTFGGLMTAYLVGKGMALNTVGVWRGISSTIGLLGTILFPLSVSRIGLISTGLWGILIQLGFLSISFTSLFMTSSSSATSSQESSSLSPMNELSILMLVFGVCASRIGLHVFDITMNQLIQLNTAADTRGVVGAVQESLNAFFDIQSYVCGIFFSDIDGFQHLVAIGYSFVALSMIIYILGVFRNSDLLER